MGKLRWTDIWLLQALYSLHVAGDFTLEKLLSVADFYEHAVLEYVEYVNGLCRLEQNGLIEMKNNCPELTKKGEELFKKYHQRSAQIQKERIIADLDAIPYSPSLQPENEPIVVGKYISKEDFEKAVDNYVKS